MSFVCHWNREKFLNKNNFIWKPITQARKNILKSDFIFLTFFHYFIISCKRKKNNYDYENNKIWENDLSCHVDLISHHHYVFLIVFYILLFHVIISIVGIFWKTWIPADQTLFRGQTSAECLPENLQWKIWREWLHCNCHFLITVSKRWMVNLKPFFGGRGRLFSFTGKSTL